MHMCQACVRGSSLLHEARASVTVCEHPSHDPMRRVKRNVVQAHVATAPLFIPMLSVALLDPFPYANRLIPQPTRQRVPQPLVSCPEIYQAPDAELLSVEDSTV